MSAAAVSLGPFVPSTPPPTTIMVGLKGVSGPFYKAIRQYDSTTPVQTDPVVERTKRTGDGALNFFGRDRGVVGLNHIYCIPYPININYLAEAELKAHFPTSSHHFVNSLETTGVGQGFHKRYVAGAISYVQEHHLPHYKMFSTIEGGNCYVFFGSQGPKAIVGLNSVALTLVGLGKQKYFEKPGCEIFFPKGSYPSFDDEDVRHARNMHIFTRLKEYRERLNFLAQNHSKMTSEEVQQAQASLEKEGVRLEAVYGNLLLAPVTKEDRLQYRHEARIWRAKDMQARQLIAYDLGVPFENVAFVPQREFHIDMDMFIDPSGDKVYVDKGAMNPSIREALQKIHCEVIVVPGVHKVGSDSINFMNGVFVSTPSGPLFVTNGVKKDRKSVQLRDRFLQTINASNPGFKIHFLDETQEVLTYSMGGIHCLTWERPNYATPLDIVLSYVDEGIPERRIREAAGEALASLDTPLLKMKGT